MKALVLAVVLGAVSVYAQTSTSTPQQNTGISYPATSPQQNPNPSGATRPQNLSERGIERIVKEVHHELVLLPFYGVFDNLAYQVAPDGTVTLMGQVVRPTLKSDAENVVKKIEGVERVQGGGFGHRSAFLRLLFALAGRLRKTLKSRSLAG